MAQNSDFRVRNATIIAFIVKFNLIQFVVVAAVWIFLTVIDPFSLFEDSHVAIAGGLCAVTLVLFVLQSRSFYYRIEWRQHDLRLHHLFGTLDLPFLQVKAIRFATPNLVTRLLMSPGEHAVITILKKKKLSKLAVGVENFSNAQELKTRLMGLAQQREDEISSATESSLKAV